MNLKILTSESILSKFHDNLIFLGEGRELGAPSDAFYPPLQDFSPKILSDNNRKIRITIDFAP